MGRQTIAITAGKLVRKAARKPVTKSACKLIGFNVLSGLRPAN